MSALFETACDVCGREMERWDVHTAGSADGVWSCPWCYATTFVGGDHFVVMRPPYAVPDGRWQLPASRALADEPGHAFGRPGQTLCGIDVPDVGAEPYTWQINRPENCAACRATALLVDERWPAGRRGRHDRVSVRRPG